MENNTNTNYTGPTSTASSSAEGRLKVGTTTPIKRKYIGRRAWANDYKPGPVVSALNSVFSQIKKDASQGTFFPTVKEMAKVGYEKLGNKVMELVDGKPKTSIVPAELSKATTTKQNIIKRKIRRIR